MDYKYHNQIVTLDEYHLERAISEEEKRHRNGTFKYGPLALTQAHASQIKQSWPPDRIQEMLAKAKDIKEEAKDRKAYLALHEFLTKTITQPDTPACKFAAIDLAFSMLTSLATGLKFDARSNWVERIIQGKRYRLRPSERFAKMIVREDQVKGADVYIFGLYKEEMRRCWMLGWASQEDMISGKRGNKNLDENLRWDEMCYYKSVEELRPMADLVRQMGIEVIPEGVLFEAVPTEASIPSCDKTKGLDILMKSPSGVLTSIMGLDDPPQPQPQKSQPIQKQPEPSPDDYTF
jgi:hypothetical protein